MFLPFVWAVDADAELLDAVTIKDVSLAVRGAKGSTFEGQFLRPLSVSCICAQNLITMMKLI